MIESSTNPHPLDAIETQIAVACSFFANALSTRRGQKFKPQDFMVRKEPSAKPSAADLERRLMGWAPRFNARRKKTPGVKVVDDG